MTELRRFAERAREAAFADVPRAARAALGQFLTPAEVGAQMAAMLEDLPGEIRVLDAGAGTGSLTAALCAELCARARPPRAVRLTAYEIDPRLGPYLQETLRRCEAALLARGVRCSHELHPRDFMADAVARISSAGSAEDLDRAPPEGFDCALVNPPYRKLRSDSDERRLLRSVGIETSNLYTAFLALIVRLLGPGGQLCAITPRSFCNGPYFLQFRRLLTDAMTLRRLHEFTARDQAFRGDGVLQETVIFTAVKGAASRGAVLLSRSAGAEPSGVPPRAVPYASVLNPSDPERIIHLPSACAQEAPPLPRSLAELGVTVATGRVVGFRARAALRTQKGPGTVPLLHPVHLSGGCVRWPLRDLHKPQHLAPSPATAALLLPAGRYVLVKRFSSKEQRRRVTAAVCEPAELCGAAWLGVENHLNVLSGGGAELPRDLAWGLCAFLNSTILDEAFRQFSGHTQVNASDLRRLRFPDLAALRALGRSLPDGILLPDRQLQLDALVAVHLRPPGGEHVRMPD